MKLNETWVSIIRIAALPRWVAAKPNVSTQLRGGGTSQPGPERKTFFFQGGLKAKAKAV